MGLDNYVREVAEVVTQLIENQNAQPDDVSVLDHHQPVSVPPKIGQILNSVDASYSVNAADAEDATKLNIEAFESAVQQQSKSFVLLMGLTRATDALLEELRLESGSETKTFRNFELPQSNFETIEKLAVLLDFVIALSQEFPSFRNDFYSLLQTITESLAAISTTTVSVFWYYLESRRELLSSTVFNSKVTLNRIAVLGICNSLTDKYYFRRKSGRLDSYEKDSFNDVFDARVRTFLTNLLEFDDLTGLNKYFALANRVSREPNLGKAKSGDDELLQDILLFHKMLRDPYSVLKTPRTLSNQVDSLDRLHAYLLEEEAKYSRSHPAPDAFAVKSDSAEELSPQGDRVIVAEHYWLSPFEPVQRGAKFDAVRLEDQKVALKQFDSSKFRRLLLLQMYLMCNFLVELQNSRKKAVLKSIGAPASTKHITEDYTPEQLMGKLLHIKRNIPRLVKGWDSQMSFMLQHLGNSEEFWWAWLMFPKLKDGAVLLGLSGLVEEDVAATVKKFEATYPYKTKRYFNSHATPQLSRKMKAKTGLALLKVSAEVPNFDDELEELNAKLESEQDATAKEEVQAEIVVKTWRKLKSMRGEHWLELDLLLDAKVLGEDEPEPTPEPTPEPKSEAEAEGKPEEKTNSEKQSENKREESEAKSEEAEAKPEVQPEEVEKDLALETPEPGTNLETTETKKEEAMDVDPVEAPSENDEVAAAAKATAATTPSRKRARSTDGDEHETKKAKTEAA